LALGAGEYATYQGIKKGKIPHIKVGRKILVPTAALRQMLGIEDSGPKAA
jgi:excisionase family DNA binding protein